MALPTTALPPVPTGISLADPNIQKQYSESVDKVLAALENKGDIPWFKLSAAMADPGRTGSAAEGFGRAMGVLGQQQEENRARQLPVAQMRAQLVGQKYQIDSEAEALNAFAKVLGTTPQDIQSGISQARNNPAMMQRLNAAMPLFYRSPKITDLAKTMFGQYKDMANTLLEEFKAGMTQADLIAKYGPEIVPMIRGMGGIQPSGVARAPASPAGGGAAEPAPTGNGMMGTPPARAPGEEADFHGTEETEKPPMPAAAPAAAPAGRIRTATEALGSPKIEADRIIAPDGEVLAERGASSLADWSKLKEATITEYNKRKAETVKFEREQISNASKDRTESFAPRIKEVGSINPDTILSTQGMYDSLDNIINSDPDMKKALGLMMKQGAGAAMYELAKNGVRVNNFGIGVDAYPAFVKQLPSEKQEKLRQMDMILSTIFVQKAKDGKSAFGPQISNFDVLLQKDQMASIRDTAKIINSWLAQERALADHKLDISGAYGDYVTSSEGTNKKPYQFFTSKEYKDITKKYGQLYRDLALTTYGAPK
jgi:hypothetical protein